MSVSKWLLAAVMTAGLALSGCATQKRVEGNEIPTQPQTDVTIPSPEMPEAPQVAEAPPPAPEPTEAPTEEPTEEPTPVPTKVVKKIETYIVVKGDTLWDISGMRIIYKDNFQWPLLFKANRDQIKDPDLIYPKQELLIRRDWTKEDTDKATKDASDTPIYVPHTKPRETLPVDYF